MLPLDPSKILSIAEHLLITPRYNPIVKIKP